MNSNQKQNTGRELWEAGRDYQGKEKIWGVAGCVHYFDCGGNLMAVYI